MNHKQPMLSRVPPPSSGQAGWPWTAEPAELPVTAADIEWPRITIVTPSYNQGQFIEETIRSILLQNYPNLEYIIVDGGSTDDSIEIIKKYEPWLAWWVSEPDAGMYDAINKGFARSTGDIMAWSNTDDIYLPDALRTVGSVFRSFPKIEWLTSLWKVQWDAAGREIKRYKVKGFNRKAFYRGRNLLGSNKFASYMIQQQSTFWRRTLWNRAGGYVDDTLDLAGDFELWARFFKFADLYALDEPVGVFRFQPDQKTATQSQEYLHEAEDAFTAHGGQYPSAIAGWFRSSVLGRIPSLCYQYFPGAAYTTHAIRRGPGDEWQLQTRRFV